MSKPGDPGSHRRAIDGCIITLREQQTGEMRVWHVCNAPRYKRKSMQTGWFTDALRQAVQQIRELEGDWCIVTICTPQTILRDVRNHGAHIAEGLRGAGRGKDVFSVGALTPEESMLGPLDALDLIERLPSYRMPARQNMHKFRPEAIA